MQLQLIQEQKEKKQEFIRVLVNSNVSLSKILKERNNVDMDLDVQIQFSNNASEMAVNKNSTCVGVLLFPGMTNVRANWF